MTLPMRAAEDQREREAEQPLAAVARSIQTMKTGAADAEADEEPALPARRAGEERERRAGVVRAHDVEERRDVAAVAELEVAEDQRLRELVERR